MFCIHTANLWQIGRTQVSQPAGTSVRGWNQTLSPLIDHIENWQ